MLRMLLGIRTIRNRITKNAITMKGKYILTPYLICSLFKRIINDNCTTCISHVMFNIRVADIVMRLLSINTFFIHMSAIENKRIPNDMINAGRFFR